MRTIKIEAGEPSQGVRDLLVQNVIGTPGKSLVYQHQKVDEKLKHIKDPVFLTVELGGKPVGACCFVRRTTWSGGAGIQSYYIRYFSFKSSFRSNVNDITRRGKKSIIRKEIEQILNGKHFSTGPHLFYAYVDPTNIRSNRMIDSYGFEEIGRFRTVYFSRFKPRLDESVEVLKGADLQLFKQQLKEHYAAHRLVTIENIGYEDGCIAYKTNGKVVAAIQANAEHWKIYEIPGSRFLIKLISSLPMLNKLIHKDFRFLSVEGIYLARGHEYLLSRLLESALRLKNRNTAIVCLDEKSGVYKLMHGLNRGFIRFLTNEKEVSVVAKANGRSLEELRNLPIYISGFDNT